MSKSNKYRVGVLFGGRSGEHEVSLASAQNVMAALEEAGHEVVPIGISRQGEWLSTQDPLAQLRAAAVALASETPSGQVAESTDSHVSMEDTEPSRERSSAKDEKSGWALTPINAEQLPATDVIFPVLHGPYGEDGTIQGLLEMGNLPYVGCGVLASAVAMDKAVAKRLFAAEGLPQANYRVVIRELWRDQSAKILAEIEEGLRYPLFVKPANMGSSVGVSKVENRADLTEAIELAASYDRKIILEEGVPSVREIEVSVLGISGSVEHQPMASVVGEIIPERDFYDYEAKYHDDSSQLLIPAALSAKQSEAIREMAMQAFRAIDGSGLARVDFLLNGENDELLLNEVNTMPGFTRISMYPKLWEATGIRYPDLVDRLVQLAIVRHQDRQQNR